MCLREANAAAVALLALKSGGYFGANINMRERGRGQRLEVYYVRSSFTVKLIDTTYGATTAVARHVTDLLRKVGATSWRQAPMPATVETPMGGGQMYSTSRWVIRQRCGLLPNYFAHLLSPLIN